MEKRTKKTIKIETVNDTKTMAKAREEFILNCRARNLVNDTILNYEKAAHVEEIMHGVGCFFLGIIFMDFMAGWSMLRLHSIEGFGKSKLRVIQVTKGVESENILSKRNLRESFQQILLLSFSPFFTIKRFTQRDARRTKRFLIIMGILVCMVFLFAIISIWSVLQPV